MNRCSLIPQLSAYDLSEAIPALSAVIHQFLLVNWGADGGDDPLAVWANDHADRLRLELGDLCRRYRALELDENDDYARTYALAAAFIHTPLAGYSVVIVPEDQPTRAAA